MIAVVTHRVSGSVRTCSLLFIEPNIWPGAVLAVKFRGPFGPGPIHVITNTMSVIKNGKSSKIWGSHKLGGWAAGPSVRRTAPAYGHRIARTWTRLIMPSTGCPSADGLPSSKFRLCWRTETNDCRGIPQSFIDKSVGEWHRRLEWLRVVPTMSRRTAGQIELMFSWHVKCSFCVYLFCLWVCIVRLFDVIKEQTIAIHHLLRLLSFARWRHFIFQSWFKKFTN